MAFEVVSGYFVQVTDCPADVLLPRDLRTNKLSCLPALLLRGALAAERSTNLFVG